MSDETFRLTPVDVRKTEFRRTLRGYEPLAVEDFRARVADELERLVRHGLALEERLRVVEGLLRDYQQREKAMNDALVAAQQLREEIRERAEREAHVILREAEADAEQRLERARRELDRLTASGQQLAQQHQAYIAALRALVERQRAELEALAGSEALAFGKIAGTISPAFEAPGRKPSPKWIRSIVEE